MNQNEDEWCSVSSEDAHEPLVGTAAVAPQIVAVELRQPWTARGFPEIDVSDAVRAVLNRQKADGARIQLIRQPQRDDGPLRLFVIDGSRDRTWALDLNDEAALTDVDFDALWRGEGPDDARLTRPAYLICTHGRRDRCCALKGMGVYQAFADGTDAEVWQTTHLGGHRFAPTLTVLPQLICYGRLPIEDVPDVITAHEANRAHALGRWRGRMAWPRPAQAAEIYYRMAHPDQGPMLDDVRLESCDPIEEKAWRVVLSTAVVEIVEQPVDRPVRKSCRDDVLKPVSQLVMRTMTAR
ncbi:MAG: sucrase ferredoxin [Myxococcota bacterium]